jgi:hypothetical protein
MNVISVIIYAAELAVAAKPQTRDQKSVSVLPFGLTQEARGTTRASRRMLKFREGQLRRPG